MGNVKREMSPLNLPFSPEGRRRDEGESEAEGERRRIAQDGGVRSLTGPGHPLLASLLTVGLTALPCQPIHAAENGTEQSAMSTELELVKEEETVSIAVGLGRDQPISDAPSNVCALTGKDIRQLSAADLPTGLRRVSGIESRRSGRLLQVFEGSVEEFFGMSNHASSIVVSQRTGNSVVSDNSLIKRVQQPAVKLLIQEAGLHEVLAEGPMDTTMLVEPQPFAQKQGLCGIEHRVICTTYREVRIALAQQSCGCLNGAPGFIEKSLRLFVHAGIATSRTLIRKAVFPFAQSCEETNTRLMVMP